MGVDTSPWAAAFGRAFDRIVADGTPAALVVRHGDEVVVDLASGHDRDGRALTSHTPVFLYSAIKPVTALAALLAVADGQLDLDVPVATIWPAFGTHGKDGVTVAQALGHGAGLAAFPVGTTIDDLADHVATGEALAAEPPRWPPGEPAEHALTYGHVVDGILRHGTGRGILDWGRDAATATGTGLSLVPGTGARAPAPLDDPGGAWRQLWLAAPGTMGEVLRHPPEMLDVDWIDGPAGRALVAPAVTGYGSAHDLAALWGWWTGDAAADRLGRELRDRSLRPEVAGWDHVLDREVAWGLGPQVDPTGVGMGGVGGCVGWYESALDLAIGFTSARVLGMEHTDPLDDAVGELT